MIFVCASFSQIWFDTSSHYTSGMCTGESLNFTERVLGYIEADLRSCNEMLVLVLLVGKFSMRSTQYNLFCSFQLSILSIGNLPIFSYCFKEAFLLGFNPVSSSKSFCAKNIDAHLTVLQLLMDNMMKCQLTAEIGQTRT